MLFGHEKGAFTGAQNSHAGKFEQAQGGTLLLDEISEMDLGLKQLLRVLQEREVERIGGTRTIALDVRVIATSNRNLREEVAAGRFPRRFVLPAECVPAASRHCASGRAMYCPGARCAGALLRRTAAAQLKPARRTKTGELCTGRAMCAS